jgi:hypothetical protein
VLRFVSRGHWYGVGMLTAYLVSVLKKLKLKAKLSVLSCVCVFLWHLANEYCLVTHIYLQRDI